MLVTGPNEKFQACERSLQVLSLSAHRYHKPWVLKTKECWGWECHRCKIFKSGLSNRNLPKITSNWRLKRFWGSTAVASREKSKRQMEATFSIKWYGTQKLNFFASAADKCEPSSSAFEWCTEGSTKPISAYKFNSEEHSPHLRPFV